MLRPLYPAPYLLEIAFDHCLRRDKMRSLNVDNAATKNGVCSHFDDFGFSSHSELEHVRQG